MKQYTKAQIKALNKHASKILDKVGAKKIEECELGGHRYIIEGINPCTIHLDLEERQHTYMIACRFEKCNKATTRSNTKHNITLVPNVSNQLDYIEVHIRECKRYTKKEGIKSGYELAFENK
jgi:hypothetical protein